ncbi:hypothetical protein Agabi119p4_7550 [Agaricus bisporus var. burnettii]|uniref:Transforming growth factor beta regulator 1 n=1 Tax=Agaricus bisporus var. burnettii TaxID=192524 RepID=A0A8H7EZD3_AGABI|nr:hypothetical protein Agabi119p4_7550 [Agaricus bisporus var. burnettii]
MTLAAANDPRTISSLSSSPSAPRPQNGAGKSTPQDKTEMELQLSEGVLEKYTPSNGSQPHLEPTRDVLVDIDPSHPPGTTSASGNHLELNHVSTSTEDFTTSGSDKVDPVAEVVSLLSAPSESFGRPDPPQEKLESFPGDFSTHDTPQSEAEERSTSTARLRSPSLQSQDFTPSKNGTRSKADASGVENVVMVARDRNSGSDDQASDVSERPPKSTRSKQKRPPDTIFQGSAKRARMTTDTFSSPVVTLMSDDRSCRTNDEDLQMNHSPSVPISTVSSNTEKDQLKDAVDAAPILIWLRHLTLLPKSSRIQIHPPDLHLRPTAPSTSSLANNPYFALSTAFLKGPPNPASNGYNPYSLYYGPGAPISPHTPTYPYPYLYQVHSPISAAMYSTSPSFIPSPTQKSPSPHTPTGAEPQRQKPKRLKAHTVTSGNHNIPIVPRDKKGKPMLPLNVGIMTVISLGEVCMREHFHTERYIFPVGYEVTRRYLSTIDPTAEVVYHCTILDGGDGPKFQIVPSDAPGREVIAGTATGAWSSIVKQANAIRSRQHSNSVSGPDFFGLGQNTIKHLIQELPNADRLKDYVWQNFIEGGPLGGRHAAVTPALPEDYDSTLPIGALYPAERERLKREVATSPRGLNHYPQHIIAQAEAQVQRKEPSGGQISGQQPNAGHPLVPSEVTLPVLNGHAMPHSSPGHLLGPGAVISSTQPSASAPPNTQGPSSVPATIASIMSAYPAPVATPPVATTSSTPPSGSASSLPS